MKDFPRIVVPPPGPKAQAIVECQDRWASTSYPKEYPLVIARGAGVMVEDVDGNRFLDFMAGIAGASPGYGPPKDVQGAQEGAGRFLHISGRRFSFRGLAGPSDGLGRVAAGAATKRGG